MAIEFEIQGRVTNIPTDLTEEAFWHRVIGFIEANGWLFGGRLEKTAIAGCVFQIPPKISQAEFERRFHHFIAANGWTFDGNIRLLIDGVYE